AAGEPRTIKAVSPPFRSYVLISREQIARNYRQVREAVGLGVEALGVVKADAYGHGAVEVSRVLVAEGARWLAVSSVDEAVALRCDLSVAGITPEYIHLSSTNAIGYGRREAWHNMVRAGHAIYGYLSPPRGPAPPRAIEVQPALEWKARILTVKEIPEGARVG